MTLTGTKFLIETHETPALPDNRRHYTDMTDGQSRHNHIEMV